MIYAWALEHVEKRDRFDAELRRPIPGMRESSGLAEDEMAQLNEFL